MLEQELLERANDFNPHPPWGGRRAGKPPNINQYCISIHTLRGEGDRQMFRMILDRGKISIHTLRGEGDGEIDEYIEKNAISIHTLRGEGDDRATKKTTPPLGISIHTLRGEGDSNYVAAGKH